MSEVLAYVFWTCNSREEARIIVHALLEKRLIVCASLVPNVESIYRWKGEIEEAHEVKVILKSRPELFQEVLRFIQSRCSYEVPEVSLILADAANRPYLDWLEQETKDLPADFQ